MTPDTYARYQQWRVAGAAAKLAWRFAREMPDAVIPPSRREYIEVMRAARTMRVARAALSQDPTDWS